MKRDDDLSSEKDELYTKSVRISR